LPVVGGIKMKINYRCCVFKKSVVALQDCPPANAEVAFVGRSNAGKSSALNYLTGQKIAKISKTPGRTQLLNYFALGNDLFLVDLPGYGYAKVDHQTRQRWQRLIGDYLVNRTALIGVIMVMDCRHPLQASDAMMLDFCADRGLQAHIILTKADKLSKNQQMAKLHALRKDLAIDWDFASAQLLSSTKRSGADELAMLLDSWLVS